MKQGVGLWNWFIWPSKETMTRFYEYKRKFWGSIKGNIFLHHLSGYYILESYSALSNVFIPLLTPVQHFMGHA